MARTEARLLTAIWSDNDFKALSPRAQWLYMLLLSQPGLSHVGTLAITLRRWAAYSTGCTVEDVEKLLAELEQHPFVVIDWDTEELLIRSFIRNDGVFKQPNVLVTACKDATAVVSLRLRSVLRDELLRLPLTDEDMLKTTSRKTPLTQVIAQLLETLSEPIPPVDNNPSPNPSSNPSQQKGSDIPTANPPGTGEVVVVGLGEDQKPTTTTKDLAQIHSIQREPPGFEKFWDAYPRHVAKGAARKAWVKATKTTDPDVVIAAVKRYADDKTRDPQYTAYPASWLNGERWTDEAPPPASNGRYSNDQWSDDTKVEL